MAPKYSQVAVSIAAWQLCGRLSSGCLSAPYDILLEKCKHAQKKNLNEGTENPVSDFQLSEQAKLSKRSGST
jgi:hypothetical protein